MYESSKLRFRGPQRALNSPYIACVGGEETFGRFVDAPFPCVLEQQLNRRCINLGSLFCGVEALTRDSGLLEIVNRSEICILQMPGLLGQSNRFYRVHQRRNDRFVAPTSELVTLYPEEDFTDIHFVRHLLARLRVHTDVRIELVRQELQKAWIERIGSFLAKTAPPVVLLRLDVENVEGGAPTNDPFAITRSMMEALRPRCAQIVELQVQASGVSDELEDMLFGTLQQPIAEHMIGPATHRRIAASLTSVIEDVSA